MGKITIFGSQYDFTIHEGRIFGTSTDAICISCDLDGGNFEWYTFSAFGEEKFKQVEGNEDYLLTGINSYLRSMGYPELKGIHTESGYTPQNGLTDGEREYREDCL
jgi:hypothetical protein